MSLILKSKLFNLPRELSLNFERCYVSGYKLAHLPATRKLEENKTKKEQKDEHEMNCLIQKARSPLIGFERIHPKSKQKVMPNDKFLGKENLPVYGGLKSYATEAERERRRQKAERLEWKTMDKYLTVDDPLTYKDIGFPLIQAELNKKEYAKKLFDNRKNLEADARLRKLKLDEVALTDEWEFSDEGVEQLTGILHHNSIYKHMFGNKYFSPVQPMNVSYADGDYENPVYYGNQLSPADAVDQPSVMFPSEEGEYYTLLMVNLDGNITDCKKKHNLHWMVTNISGGNVESGDVQAPYLMPLPMRGTGFHRIVFILFKQSKKLNLDAQKLQSSESLSEREFSVKKFHDRYKKFITPTSARFFQTMWDGEVKDKFHELDMSEPVYRYEVPSKNHVPLKRHPDVGQKKTLLWYTHFMPEEPIYPGGGQFE